MRALLHAFAWCAAAWAIASGSAWAQSNSKLIPPATSLPTPMTAPALPTATAKSSAADKNDPDPMAILAASKEASGGKAWDALTLQHTLVEIIAGGLSGEAERWSEISTGRSFLHFELGPMSGKLGYDGTVAWSQDPTGKTQDSSADIETQLAINTAYRDQLAFWFPQRRAADITYKRRASVDGADFDVIAITPKGGREFELWVNTETKMIERLVEREAIATRTEMYMDWQDVHGVQIPFRVRATRGDPKTDEIVTVERIEFDGPHEGISFVRPQ